jgi:hypothetical protein
MQNIYDFFGSIMSSQITINILSNVLSIPVIAFIGWIIYSGMKRYQFGRLIVWWWFGGKKLRTAPKTIFEWNKIITHAIKLVADNLGVMRTFQGSPIGMPLATCSVEFYHKVMFMAWLSVQPDNALYKKITTEHHMGNGRVYYDSDNESKFDEWSKDLLASYEGDFEQIAIMSYSDFMWVFRDTLFSVA